MRIEFGHIQVGDVGRQHLREVLDSNWLSAGPKVALFEERWNNLFGYGFSRAVSSGTDACLNCCLSLYDFGAQRGDEIITPALSYIATSNAIRAAGFVPVFCDINRETLNIDPDKIETLISSKTRAIQVVHTMGRPCEMAQIIPLAKKHNLKLLEDCCEAHGARYRGRYVGTFGHAAAFSFYIAHLICSAEGGMVSTQDPEVARVIDSTRSHGRRDGALYFDFPRTGLNSKMNDLEAAIGLDGIDNFWDTFNKRHQNVRRIRQVFKPYPGFAYYSEEDPDNINCPHAFSVTLKNPQLTDSFKSWLDRNSIHWKRNFGSIPTQHGAFADLGHKLGDFPEAEYVGDNGVHFGVHQYLTDADLCYIEDILRGFLRYSCI